MKSRQKKGFRIFLLLIFLSVSIIIALWIWFTPKSLESDFHLLSGVQKALESGNYSRAAHILETIEARLGELDLKKSEEKKEPVDLYCKLGEIYMKSGEFGKAEEQFKKALEIDPENALPHLEMANLMLALEKEEDKKKALSLLPAEYGGFIAFSGRPDIAIKHYYDMIREIEDSEAKIEPGPRVEARLKLFRLLVMENRKKEALKQLEMAFDELPSRIEEDDFLKAAELYRSMGNFKNARLMTEKAKELEDKDKDLPDEKRGSVELEP
ncbi:MAG: tetratricopeptide repeat protein [Candidatus Eremiobacteraeota bacterium]|nr:tetratricopeptide repeat protein [Candidatus Eremiobacteraeota bacterium]